MYVCERVLNNVFFSCIEMQKLPPTTTSGLFFTFKRTVPYLLARRCQNTFGNANFTPSPTLKFKILPVNKAVFDGCIDGWEVKERKYKGRKLEQMRIFQAKRMTKKERKTVAPKIPEAHRYTFTYFFHRIDRRPRQRTCHPFDPVNGKGKKEGRNEGRKERGVR